MLKCALQSLGWTVIFLCMERILKLMDLIPYRACHIEAGSESMLFAASAFNGIFQMDLKNGEVQYIGIIPGEKIFQCSLYGGMIAWENWLVAIPLAAKELAVLDRKTGQCVRKIKLPGNEKVCWKFAAAAAYGDDIILIPACYPYFLSLHMIDFSVSVLQNWKKCLKKDCALNNQQQLAVFTIGRQDTCVYLQVLDTDCLLKFDLVKKKIIRIWHLPEKSGTFALCDDQNIYVVPGKSGEILCMNDRNGKIERTWPMPVTIDEHIEGHVCVHGRIIQKKLILFPQMASRIGVVDLNTGETRSYAGEWSVEQNGKKKNIFQKINILDERYAVVLVCHEINRDYDCFLIDTCDFSEKRLKMKMLWNREEFVKTAISQCADRKEMIGEETLGIFECKDILAAFFAGVESKSDNRQQWKNGKTGAKIYWSLGKGGK